MKLAELGASRAAQMANTGLGEYRTELQAAAAEILRLRNANITATAAGDGTPCSVCVQPHRHRCGCGAYACATHWIAYAGVCEGCLQMQLADDFERERVRK